MPAGQGVGAIKGLIPAGDLVRQIMAEAEQVIDSMKKFAK
jgi:NAD(P)H-dependent flavin oxidoreductase YrpB (nitropropane dioxygenase family)